ncbi:hypothetical protein D917_06637 [Trichinella nativa]|uniref:Retrotransposon gag domain-containing protein n=1 Tax=Trichinella nativa TaxID=6335 RepID=A0A1Y3ERQ1_9BILA|nr:hypothetical protein D917_06637 [Trichinella nativa]
MLLSKKDHLSKLHNLPILFLTNFDREDFVQLTVEPGIDLVKILRLYLTGSTFEYVQGCKTYDDTIAKLNEVYVKPKYVIFARHEFISRKQRDGESLEEFLHALQRLSKNCEYKNVTAEQYHEEMIRDAFINNMSSNEIRTRLLEHSVISLQEGQQGCGIKLCQRKCEAIYQVRPDY